VPDWERPAGAVEWPKLIAHLQKTRLTGSIPPEHKGHTGWGTFVRIYMIEGSLVGSALANILIVFNI
jgi:nicotinamide/nicotinate riboside kinase